MFGSLEIRTFLALDRSPAVASALALSGVSDAVYADELIARLGEMQRAGTRVVLVTVSGPGGHVYAAGRVAAALRAFSDAGGYVITLMSGRVASAAPSIAVAGDLVLMDPEAYVLLHSAEAARSADVEQGNAWMAQSLCERTALPRGAVLECLSRRYSGLTTDGAARCVIVSPREAIGNGIADALATACEAEMFARLVANAAAAGRPLPSKRHEQGGALWRLRQRPEVSWSFAPASTTGAAPYAPGAIVSASIAADALAADSLRTSNYSESGGVPTLGAKMDKTGNALKVAPGNLQVGNVIIDQTWWVKANPVSSYLLLSGGSYTFPGVGGGQTPTRVGLSAYNNHYTTQYGLKLRLTCVNYATGSKDAHISITPRCQGGPSDPITNVNWTVYPVAFPAGGTSDPYVDVVLAFYDGNGVLQDPASISGCFTVVGWIQCLQSFA